MSSSYHQLLISDKLKELFCFHSSTPENQHFCATRLSQGWSASPSLASWVFKTIIDVCNSIELKLDLEEFMGEIERIDQGLVPYSDPWFTFIYLISSYLDDIHTQSPHETELDRFNLEEKSFWRPPVTPQDKGVFLHLMIVKKVLRVLRRANLLLSPKKTCLLVENDFNLLGFRFIQSKGMLLPLKVSEQI